ncbi:DUF1566 domain-containing protein [Methylibium sp.]|uniref:Lcl C-terminal domain-containing protein n=1 Tax=Methylibium sp. TaxID=2067992 RepID=UPI003BA8DAF6
MSTNTATKSRRAAPSTPVAWLPRIGQLWPGQGIYAGIVRGEIGKPDHHLFLSEDDATSHAGVAWGGAGQDEPGAKSSLDGLANTRALVNSSHDHPAAEWAHSLNADGHRDWYLPSRRELRLCWVNAPQFFVSGWYWTSTQYSPLNAWIQNFGGGSQYLYVKAYEARARAVRRFLIT